MLQSLVIKYLLHICTYDLSIVFLTYMSTLLLEVFTEMCWFFQIFFKTNSMSEIIQCPNSMSQIFQCPPSPSQFQIVGGTWAWRKRYWGWDSELWYGWWRWYLHAFLDRHHYWSPQCEHYISPSRPTEFLLYWFWGTNLIFSYIAVTHFFFISIWLYVLSICYFWPFAYDLLTWDSKWTEFLIVILIDSWW